MNFKDKLLYASFKPVLASIDFVMFGLILLIFNNIILASFICVLWFFSSTAIKKHNNFEVVKWK